MNDKIVMPVWTIGVFLVVMNTTMFNVSIPSIIHDLGITADLGSWIISSYSIGYALSTVIFSRLSDIVPIRKLLLIGLTILGLSSILGLVAHNFSALLTARISQSAGAGTMAGLGLVLASRYIPFERRGRAIAMISGGSALAFGLGPVVGGLITEYLGWNGLFAVTCLILFLLPILLRLMPKEQSKPFRFDVAGALLTIINAVALLLSVTQRSLIWLAISILSLALHAFHLKRKKEPFIKQELLTQTAFRKLLTSGFCLLVVNLGNLFLMPFVLANLFGKSALVIGLFIAPGAIFSAFLTRFVGGWIDRYGSYKVLIFGHSILVLVLAVFSLDLTVSSKVILFGYVFFSPAFSATLASLNNETSRILPKPLIGSGMGLAQLIQFFGGSFSVAVCGLLISLQKNVPLSFAYQHVYMILCIISLFSMAVLIWYRKLANNPESYRPIQDNPA